MGSELKAAVGHICVVGGRPVSEAPNLLAVHGQEVRGAGTRRKGDLFVVVELRNCDAHSTAGRQRSQALLQTICDAYYQSAASLTASLHQALNTANTQLRQAAIHAAEGTPDPQSRARVQAGVVAVVVRDGDAFIAALGPAVCYAISGSQVTRYPASSPWLDSTSPVVADEPLLGLWDEIDPQMSYVSVKPGDILLLGDSRLAALLTVQQVEKAAAFQSLEAVLANLNQLVNGRDCTALAVEIQNVRESSISPVSRAGRLRRAGPDTAEVTSAERTTVRHPGEAHEAIEGNGTGWRLELPVGHWLRGLARGWIVLLMASWAGLRMLVGRMLPGHRQEAPTRQVAASPRHGYPSPLSQYALRTLAIVIPIIVLITVAIAYWQRGVAWEEEFNSRVAQAQFAYQQALSAGDVQASRSSLANAQELLDQAEAIRPGAPEVGALRTLIIQRQDKVDRVERLYWVGVLHKYQDAQTQLRRVICNGTDLYVLDAGIDQVFYHQLNEMKEGLRAGTEDTVIIRRGQQVGNNVVGEIVDITWRGVSGNSNQGGSLLIVGRDGVWEYDTRRGLNALLIAERERWMLPAAAVAYADKLYVLDRQAQQIFRYLPANRAYPNPAEPFFASRQPGLTDALDMAIDGFIYILFTNSRIAKYAAGSPAAFELNGLDKPLSNATAIFALPDQMVRYLYVVDAGNRRIVQLTKDGRFTRQIRPGLDTAVDFGGLRTVCVDEAGDKLYAADAHSLYIANLPHIP